MFRRRCHCSIVIPRHHSAQNSSASSSALLRRLISEADRAANSACSNDGVDTSDGCGGGTHHSIAAEQLPRQMLILQCHSEGVFWRGLLPLLSSMQTATAAGLSEAPSQNGATNINAKRTDMKDNSCDHHSVLRCRRQAKITSRAVSILINHFRDSIRRVEVTVDSDHDCNHSDGHNDCSTTSYDNHLHQLSYSSSKKWFISQTYYRDDSNNRQCQRGNLGSISTIIILLPPNPYNQQHQRQHNNPHYYSRTPSTRPTNPFTLRLIHFENTFIRLTSLSAYISTLGGGFFLCRYLSTAVSLARHQRAIAIMRGDTDMALKCRINEGYCYIHAGKLNRGKRVIRHVLKDVIQLQVEKEQVGLLDGKEDGLLHHTPERELSELTVIKNMCYSALRFANLIREASAAGSLAENGEVGEQLHDVEEGKQDINGSSSIIDIVTKNGKGNNISTTHDDFQRIRIVQDRTWK